MFQKLVEIPPEKWSKLRDLYAHRKPYASSYNLLQMCVNWYNQNPNISETIKIVSLENYWETDGTFIVYDSNQINCNTLSDDLQTLSLALRALKAYGVRDISSVTGFQKRVLPAVQEYLSSEPEISRNMNLIPCFHYYAEPALVHHFDTTPPPGYRISELSVKHASIVNQHWPHVFPDSIKYVEHMIRYNPSVCAYDETGQLVAWCLVTPLGALGLLHVLDSHRRMGLGSLMVRCIAKALVAQDLAVFACILMTNKPSQKMFETLGFKVIDHVYWALKESS